MIPASPASSVGAMSARGTFIRFSSDLTLGLLVCIVLWIFMRTKGRGYTADKNRATGYWVHHIQGVAKKKGHVGSRLI